MRAIVAITAALHVVVFMAFAWAIARLFRRERRLPLGMRLLALGGSGASLALLALLLLAPSDPVARWLGAIGLYALSLGVFVWSCRAIWDARLPIAFSDHEPPGIQQHGPYAFVRHPFYLSYAMAYVAAAIAAGHVAAWGIAAAMSAIYWRLAVQEERALLTRHVGDEYARYMQRTGRFVPSLARILRGPHTNDGDARA